MAAPLLKDSKLIALAAALDLRIQATSAWQTEMGQLVQGPKYGPFRALCAKLGMPATQVDPSILAMEDAFYRLVGADDELFRLSLEGRLGYYDAVLPAVAEVVARTPRARIADLGSFAGLVSLYLGKNFPEAHVIGIERCEDAVRRARQFQGAAGTPNVEFAHADYTQEGLGAGFDVVVSLQTMPSQLLPRVPSASPEDFMRGPNLARAAAQAAWPVPQVAQALAAVRALTRPGGRAILHERIYGFPFAALFLYLAARAGLRVSEMRPLTWRTAAEGGGDQASPLGVAEAHDGPAPWDEQALLAAYLPRRDPAPLSGPEMRQGVRLTGPTAQFTFESLEGRRRDVCIHVTKKDGGQSHIHFGRTDQGLAYIYTSTDLDFRELKVADGAQGQAMFQQILTYTDQLRRNGDIASVSPERATLLTLLKDVTQP